MCACHLTFRFWGFGVGWGGQSGGGRGVSGVFTVTHQERERPWNLRKIEIIIE